MTIRALAMDQSPTATGWGIGSPGEKKPLFGLFRLPAWNNEEGARLLAFENWFLDMIKTHGVTDVFHEAPVEFHGPKSPLVSYKQDALIGCIQLNTYRALKKEPRQVPVDSWRSRFLGTTKAPPGLKGDHARKHHKQMAMRACAMRGWLVDDDNVAEALGILDFGLSTLDRRHASSTDILFRRAELNLWNGER